MSSVRTPTIASTSRAVSASANRRANAYSSWVGFSRAGSIRSWDRNVVRARLSWVATASDDVPNIVATSPPLNPMTSRSTSTARPRGLRACTAAMKASETDSRVSMRVSGPGAGSGRASRRVSGYACSHVTASVPLGGGPVCGGGAAG